MRNILFFYRMVNIFEMLYAGIFDRDFPERNAKGTNKFNGIMICTPCCSEAWHGYTKYLLARHTEIIESHRRNQKRQSRIQTA